MSRSCYKRIVGVGVNRDAGSGAYFHCVSRVVDRRLIFKAGEKEVFRSILRKLEAFLGVRIVTYCVMGNHFHLLLEVPDRKTLASLDAERLLALLPLLYDKAAVDTVAKQLAALREKGDVAGEKALLARYERRRGDLSIFLKELKQRVSIFMNHRLGRVGTLWEGRFRSVLVEGGEAALLTVAAYIDLNPVRAGLAARPEDYRWSGFGEACGAGKGAKLARESLGAIQREGLEAPGTSLKWRETQDRYRRLLYHEGVERKGDESTGAGARRGMSQEECERVIEAPEGEALARSSHAASAATFCGPTPLRSGPDFPWTECSRTAQREIRSAPCGDGSPPRLVMKRCEKSGLVPLPEMLRRKVRYFSDGAVLGSAAFVDSVVEELKAQGRLPTERKRGACRLRGGADWGELRVLRNLQVRVVGPTSD